ncbi:MAG: YdcF family protein [Candidatus Gracilibacteria bacterium]|nr:YdcF family protein [Candidatus Gracilibacteria bacterium]
MPVSFFTLILSPALILMTTFFQVHMGGSISATPDQGDCLVIMGSKVLRNGQPDLMMRERVSKALEVIDDSYEVIIVSGGTIDDDVPAESTVLKRLLMNGGVAGFRIIEEPESTSTYENLLYSQPLLNENGCEAVDLLSHNFHLARVFMTAERLGVPVNRLIGAKAEGRSLERQLKREYAAYVVYWLGWDWMSRTPL